MLKYNISKLSKKNMNKCFNFRLLEEKFKEYENEDEIDKLLNSASYSLPKNSIYDLIIRFCFKERIYNLNDVNDLLEVYNCKLFL